MKRAGAPAAQHTFPAQKIMNVDISCTCYSYVVSSTKVSE